MYIKASLCNDENISIASLNSWIEVLRTAIQNWQDAEVGKHLNLALKFLSMCLQQNTCSILGIISFKFTAFKPLSRSVINTPFNCFSSLWASTHLPKTRSKNPYSPTCNSQQQTIQVFSTSIPVKRSKQPFRWELEREVPLQEYTGITWPILSLTGTGEINKDWNRWVLFWQ